MQEPNRFGCIPRMYETDSNWVEYECRCGQRFWARGPASMVRNCRQVGGQCRTVRSTPEKPVVGTTKLKDELLGARFGGIEVVGQERGKGWKVRCDCGRERFILSGTAILGGAYKSCGQCTYEERSAAATTKAPSSALRASDVAEMKFTIPLNPDSYPEGVGCFKQCASGDHPDIWYKVEDGSNGMDSGEDCPLCLALARLELQGEERTGR